MCRKWATSAQQSPITGGNHFGQVVTRYQAALSCNPSARLLSHFPMPQMVAGHSRYSQLLCKFATSSRFVLRKRSDFEAGGGVISSRIFAIRLLSQLYYCPIWAHPIQAYPWNCRKPHPARYWTARFTPQQVAESSRLVSSSDSIPCSTREYRDRKSLDPFWEIASSA
jgi:hypothetical protein